MIEHNFVFCYLKRITNYFFNFTASVSDGEPRATRSCSGDEITPATWEGPVLNCFDVKANDNNTDVFESLNNVIVYECLFSLTQTSKLFSIFSIANVFQLPTDTK